MSRTKSKRCDYFEDSKFHVLYLFVNLKKDLFTNFLKMDHGVRNIMSIFNHSIGAFEVPLLCGHNETLSLGFKHVSYIADGLTDKREEQRGQKAL